MTGKGGDVFDMSDEDFLNNPPADVEVEVGGADDSASLSSSESDPVGDTLGDEDDNLDLENLDEDKPSLEEGDDDNGELEDIPDADAAAGDADAGTDPKAKAEEKPDAGKADAAPESGKQEEGTQPQTQEAGTGGVELKPEEYKAFFEQVMKPFKANGREVKLRTPEEAIRLMQMGAGYGRKLQDMQPHLKSLRMLEKHDLLDEGKLSFLIDLNQKNPEAIKKLLKDSAIDPLDLNMEDNAQYTPSNHSVSDAEMAFEDVLAEVKAAPRGIETIRLVNQTWDQESKSALWETPGILKVIQSQRENGIYDRIMSEIDHQKLLGNIPPSMPFLQAYKLAGDTLVRQSGIPVDGQQPAPQTPAQGGSVPLVQTTPPQPQPRVLATRAAAPKPQVANGARAKAAATPQASARKAAQVVNPFDMADDDFLKEQMAGRL